MADPVVRISPPAASKDADDVAERRSMRDYYIILRERLWIALPLALLVSVTLGYFQARVTPMYMSTATMQFEKPEVVVTSQAVLDPSVRSDIEMNTNIQILSSMRLRTRVFESFTPEEIQILQRGFMKNAKSGSAPRPARACWAQSVSTRSATAC